MEDLSWAGGERGTDMESSVMFTSVWAVVWVQHPTQNDAADPESHQR